eukprot:TRINITY_DN37003_c0_g1_i2.p1 TRINITY_DN37003_c0_g1~~TRINITY_DN37003_c0_g1_i2.p1  ORF type:complete len:407 (+),score=114.06 TRINITY_DN37003_c0_g1_i2:145-1365(+)
MRRVVLVLLLICAGSLCEEQEIDEYKLSWDESHGSFVLSLFNGTTLVHEIKAEPFQNLTSIGRAEKVFGGEDFIPMMLEEAAGGRCDACVRLTRELWRLTTQLLSEKGSMKPQDVVGKKYVFSLDMEDPAVNRRFSGLCQSENYRQLAPHIVKGCVEIMNFHANDIILRISETMKDSVMGYPNLPNSVCSQLLGICPVIPVPDTTRSHCASCAAVVNELHYRLRGDSRSGKILSRDPMVLSKKKAGVAPFMGRRHVLSRVQALCDELALNMLIPVEQAERLSETCETLVEEQEERLVTEFSSHRGQQKWRDPVRGICVDEIGVCSTEEFNEVEGMLAQRWVGSESQQPAQRLEVHKDAFHISVTTGFKEQELVSQKKASARVANPTQSSLPTTKVASLEELSLIHI